MHKPKEGDTIFVVSYTGKTGREAVVTKVARKYFWAKPEDGYTRKYCLDNWREATDFRSEQAYMSKEAWDDKTLRERLFEEIRTEYFPSSRYGHMERKAITTEKLQKIKAILEEGNNVSEN